MKNSYDLFEKKYQPIHNQNIDEDTMQFYCLEKALQEARKFSAEEPTSHLWTISEYEDNMYLISGNRTVNRIMWVVTENRHDHNQTYIWHISEEF